MAETKTTQTFIKTEYKLSMVTVSATNSFSSRPNLYKYTQSSLSLTLTNQHRSFGKYYLTRNIMVWSAMGQMRDADEVLGKLKATGSKLPSYRVV
ncbi:hypothetical protein TNCV_3386101 [Trichonephila clavipes]|nr:hypothetical protein TNCV_3386101 [Trichonephila clavipes]